MEGITITLTRQEYFALVSILVDHRRTRDSTLEWVDVLNDRTVTIDDLMMKVTGAEGKRDDVEEITVGEWDAYTVYDALSRDSVNRLLAARRKVNQSE